MPQPRIVRGFDLYEKLREHKPASVTAYDQDDEAIKIAVPEVRQRHARVIDALKDITWVKVDLLDKKGALLHRHLRCADDRDSPAGELEDLRPATRQAAELQGIVQVVSTALLKAQDLALARHTAGVQQLLDSHNRLSDSMSRRLDLQETQLQHAMTLNHALSSDLVNAQLAQLQLRIGEPPANDDEERPHSDRTVAAMLPMLLRAALGIPPDRAPKTVAANANAANAANSNGVKKKTEPKTEAPKTEPPTS